MVLRAAVSSAALVALACGDSRGERPAPAPPSEQPAQLPGTLVTVYAETGAFEEVLPAMLGVASRNRWVLSVRTDREALAEADLIVTDSAGRLVARVRPGAGAAAQAQLLADVVRAPSAVR